MDIDKNVSYTINCEGFGIKHHLNIKRTYATVNKMGKNPPDCDIDAPIVVADAVWPQKQYEICVNSGLQDEFKSIMPENMMSDADYVFPASCAANGDKVIPIRKAGKDKTVWLAPDGTTSFKAGSNMTKITGTAAKIKTPAESGEYYIFVTDVSGKILSKSKNLLRVSGGNAAMTGDAVEAASYDVQTGVDKQIDARDLTLLNRAVHTGSVAGLEPADLNGDLSVDADDAGLLAKYLCGTITRFPADE